MDIQFFQIAKRPIYASTFILVFAGLVVLFIYSDEFLFFAPYLTLYVPPDRAPYLALDLVISGFSGIVILASLFQLSHFPRSGSNHTKTSFAGIIAAIIAGACPCYYLVPLLAFAGGAGGFLAVLGVTFNTYQIPIKLASLSLLVSVAVVQERSLRAQCAIDPGLFLSRRL
ncbi:MAG: hypothetical protein OK422_05625 [Thaumarchaeota archaeon]|nr:hypothetical protein [Nitrososphaerota archaeon]